MTERKQERTKRCVLKKHMIEFSAASVVGATFDGSEMSGTRNRYKFGGPEMLIWIKTEVLNGQGVIT
jgi:hypothetical protein